MDDRDLMVLEASLEREVHQGLMVNLDLTDNQGSLDLVGNRDLRENKASKENVEKTDNLVALDLMDNQEIREKEVSTYRFIQMVLKGLRSSMVRKCSDFDRKAIYNDNGEIILRLVNLRLLLC